MQEAIKKTQIDYKYFSIDENLEIINVDDLKEGDYILYINYFGIKNVYINSLINKYGEKLIIDNSQSFFSKFGNNVSSIYSPRKFFGVSDGAYLVGSISGEIELEIDHSVNRMEHLLGRIDGSASAFFRQRRELSCEPS